MAIPVFIAYAREDEAFKNALIQHLAVLVDNGTITHWHDQEIPDGSEWEPQIDARLREARLIVLLVSPRFLASRYCKEKEMAGALARHTSGEAVVLPVLVRSCLWDRTALSKLQMLPKDAKPVNTWPDQDEVWTGVVAKIEATALKLRDADAQAERQAGQSRVVPVANPLPAATDGFPWRKARWPALVAALLVGGGVLTKVWPKSTPLQDSTSEGTAQPFTLTSPALEDMAPMAFRKLPTGSFTMGSPEGETGRDADEKQHPAEVSTFEIGVHEVTQKQWKSVMGVKAFDCAYGCGDSTPAHSVTWFETVAFMNKLTELENKKLPEDGKRTVCYSQKNGEWIWDRECTGYRLPTEAEWEYAARAGTTTAYSFGNDANDICRYGNGGDAAAKRKHPDWTGLTPTTCEDDKYPELAPVGSFKPNPWGLYDMHGNAWEWIWDLYAEYPSSSKPGYAGPDKTPEARRVLRGGSFFSEPRRLRSSNRDWYRPTYRYGDFGFRCVRGSLPPASSP